MGSIQIADKQTLDNINNELDNVDYGLTAIKALIQERSNVIESLNISLDKAYEYMEVIDTERQNEINKIMTGNDIIYLFNSKASVAEDYSEKAKEYEDIATDEAGKAKSASNSETAYNAAVKAETAAIKAQEYSDSANELMEEIQELSSTISTEEGV